MVKRKEGKVDEPEIKESLRRSLVPASVTSRKILRAESEGLKPALVYTALIIGEESCDRNYPGCTNGDYSTDK